MTATWPVDLPKKLRLDDVSEAIGDGRLRSQTDTGPGKVRRRSSAMSRPVSGTMIMTTTQLDAFIGFVNDDLKGGALPFLMPPPRGGDDWLVRIGQQMPSWSQVGAAKWIVSLALDVLP